MKLPQNAGRLTDRPGHVRGALPERGAGRGIRRREDPRAHPHRRDDHRTGDPGRRGDRRAGGRGGQPAAGDRGGARGVQSRLLRLYEALEKSALTFEALSPRILSRRQREDRLAAAREDAARQLTQRKVELPSGQEIKAYVADSRSFLEEGTFPERKALIRDFVKGVEVAGDEATLSYTIPMPAPMPAGGVTSERTPVPGCPEWWTPTASTGTGSGAAHPSSTSSASASAATCCAWAKTNSTESASSSSRRSSSPGRASDRRRRPRRRRGRPWGARPRRRESSGDSSPELPRIDA